MEHPAILNLAQVKSHEERRVDWLTYNNINTWTDAAKEYLVRIGMLENNPGTICECVMILCYDFY